MRSMAQFAAIRCSQVARAARPSKPSQLRVRLQKRLLHHVLRVLFAPGQPVRHPEHTGAVPLDDRAEGLTVS